MSPPIISVAIFDFQREFKKRSFHTCRSSIIRSLLYLDIEGFFCTRLQMLQLSDFPGVLQKSTLMSRATVTQGVLLPDYDKA